MWGVAAPRVVPGLLCLLGLPGLLDVLGVRAPSVMMVPSG
jgi:hypothetical protein